MRRSSYAAGFLTGALVMFLLALAVVMLNTRPARAADGIPHIVSQHTTKTGARELVIVNPLRKPLWLYIECENVLTIHPIGVPGYRRIAVQMKDPEQPIVTDCFLHSWIVQGSASPLPWYP